MNNKWRKITPFRFLILFISVFIMVAYTLLPDAQQKSEITGKKAVDCNLAMFKVNNQNWGYMIVKEGKIVIKQDVIPAISGNQQFDSRSDAKKVGSLVLQKMRSGRVPTIKIQELDSLSIKVDKNI